MEKLLVVDHESEMQRFLKRLVESDTLIILEATTGVEALACIREEKPDLVLLETKLGDENGLDILRQIRAADPKLLVIMTTSSGTTQTAIEAIKLGAYDYMPKSADELKWPAVIENALKASRAMRQVVSFQPLLSQEEYSEGIVGKSEPMQAVYKLIGKAAPTDATVLLTGESGTGKEIVARALYHHSARVGKPFLAVNCAAIPEQLLESELFGHEKGAFTGAVARHIGRFEQCEEGTIFLDEIGDMTQTTQAKILRVLQEGDFSRVGGRENIHTDVRLIAATNKNLEAAVKAREFREDLYYRLNVVRIHLPPLRDRREDVPILAEYFLQRLAREFCQNVKTIASSALKKLRAYNWPGNVRELENALQRALVVSHGDVLLLTDLPKEISGENSPTAVNSSPSTSGTGEVNSAIAILYQAARKDPKWKVIAAVERELIVHALDEASGNQVHAAKFLGITRATLRKRIIKFGIKRELQIQ